MTDPQPDVAARTDRAATDPPAVLVDLVARALASAYNDDGFFAKPDLAGPQWDVRRGVYRNDARTVLAALFAAAEIHEQFGYRYPAGEYPDQWPGPRCLAEGAAVRSGKAVLLRRIVLTLPAETIPLITDSIDGGQSQ